MYRGKFPQPYSNPNLKILLLESTTISITESVQKFMIRQIPILDNSTIIKHVRDKVQRLLKNNLVGTVRDRLSSVPRSLKDQSANVLRVWAHQCECVLAQRLRRGQQMFCLYSRLWDEHDLREFLRQMRHRATIKGRDFIFAAIGVAAFDWQNQRISDQEMRSYINELDYVYRLRERTMSGSSQETSGCDPRSCHCDQRQQETKEPPPNSKSSPKLSSYDDWVVFIDKDDLIVWRRLHSSGNYEYKVYGSYNDVTAEDFLNVQLDVTYRRIWDATAVRLEIVEEDPDPTTNADIIYWEMLWPKLFSNRDYVYQRRYMVDHQSNTILVVSKGTEHHKRPKIETKYRVEDYWSYMVIKAQTDFNKNGIEFCLTYFDNPGMNIPATITTWVALKAMPDFLGRLREASKRYKTYCMVSGVCCMCKMTGVSHEVHPVEEDWCQEWEFCDPDKVVTDNTIFEPQHNLSCSWTPKKPSQKPPPRAITGGDDGQPEKPAESSQTSNVEPATSHKFWKYLHPTYYFS